MENTAHSKASSSSSESPSPSFDYEVISLHSPKFQSASGFSISNDGHPRNCCLSWKRIHNVRNSEDDGVEDEAQEKAQRQHVMYVRCTGLSCLLPFVIMLILWGVCKPPKITMKVRIEVLKLFGNCNALYITLLTSQHFVSLILCFCRTLHSRISISK